MQNVAAVAAAVLAVVFGLPAIKQSLDLANSLPHRGFLGVMAEPVRRVAGAGATGVWGTYLGLVALLFLLLPVVVSPRFELPSRRAKQPGRAWSRGTIKITRMGPGEEIPTEETETPERGGSAGPDFGR